MKKGVNYMIRSDLKNKEYKTQGTGTEVLEDYAFITCMIIKEFEKAGLKEKEAIKEIKKAFKVGLKHSKLNYF